MIGLFKLYSLDNGSLIVVCGNCGYHLVITKELLVKAGANTIVGEAEILEYKPTKISDIV